MRIAAHERGILRFPMILRANGKAIIEPATKDYYVTDISKQGAVVFALTLAHKKGITLRRFSEKENGELKEEKAWLLPEPLPFFAD